MKTNNKSKKIPRLICPLCLCKLEIIDESSTNGSKTLSDITEMIQEIFHIQIESILSSKNHELNHSCNACQEKLLNSYEFYCTIQKSQEILKSGKLELIDSEECKNNCIQDPLVAPLNTSKIKLEDLDLINDEFQGLDSSVTEDNILQTKRKTRQRKAINTSKEKSKRSDVVSAAKLKDSSNNNIRSKKYLVRVVSKEEKLEEDQRIREFYSLVCTSCTKQFETFGNFRSHMKEKHQIERPAIMCCKKRFSKRCRLLEHLIFHVNPEEYQCTSCGKQCLNKFRLEQHRLQHHSSLETRKYQCDKCLKRFLIPANLKAHLLTHLSQEEKDRLKTYTCDDCGNHYSSKYLIEQHIRKIHLKVYSFVCDVCAKPFKTKNDFLYHYSHIHATTKEPRVQCNICFAWLTNERCLKTHFRRIHANPGPHICNVCGKVSPTSEALRSHQRYVHEAQRKFQCTYCQKAFKKEVNLKEHMTTHLGGVLYTCCFCDKTFNSGANMYSHRKKKHPEENAKLNEENQKEKLGLNNRPDS